MLVQHVDRQFFSIDKRTSETVFRVRNAERLTEASLRVGVDEMDAISPAAQQDADCCCGRRLSSTNAIRLWDRDMTHLSGLEQLQLFDNSRILGKQIAFVTRVFLDIDCTIANLAVNPVSIDLE